MLKSNYWKNFIENEWNQEYFTTIRQLLYKSNKKKIYPKRKDIFKVFNLDIDDIKVVLIGQDPYHQLGQAMGLSFSVPKGVDVPPSLKNIYKELFRSLNVSIPNHGDLTKWFNQGVFLLNTILTVEDSKPLSHKNIGWEIFTSKVIKELLKREKKLIFICLGNKSKSLFQNVKTHHIILSTSHPSPFSFYHGFWKSNIFAKTNEELKLLGEKEIDWSL